MPALGDSVGFFLSKHAKTQASYEARGFFLTWTVVRKRPSSLNRRTIEKSTRARTTILHAPCPVYLADLPLGAKQGVFLAFEGFTTLDRSFGTPYRAFMDVWKCALLNNHAKVATGQLSIDRRDPRKIGRNAMAKKGTPKNRDGVWAHTGELTLALNKKKKVRRPVKRTISVK